MKNNLVQIIYISRSTFPTMGNSSTVDPSVARILAKSRSNNKKKGLVGVLYFGDGCFFQCLEGKETDVDALYATLLKDDRHKDLKVLSRKMIKRPSFKDWSMKYVALDSEIKNLMTAYGYGKFDPYQFDNDMTNKVLELLHLALDPEGPRADITPIATEGSAAFIAKCALAISIFSAVIAIYALMKI